MGNGPIWHSSATSFKRVKGTWKKLILRVGAVFVMLQRNKKLLECKSCVSSLPTLIRNIFDHRLRVILANSLHQRPFLLSCRTCAKSSKHCNAQPVMGGT